MNFDSEYEIQIQFAQFPKGSQWYRNDVDDVYDLGYGASKTGYVFDVKGFNDEILSPEDIITLANKSSRSRMKPYDNLMSGSEMVIGFFDNISSYKIGRASCRERVCMFV